MSAVERGDAVKVKPTDPDFRHEAFGYYFVDGFVTGTVGAIREDKCFVICQVGAGSVTLQVPLGAVEVVE
jgi:hypothetical protein